MSFAGAISRSRVLKLKADTPVAMVKWWKKMKNTNAEVRYALLFRRLPLLTRGIYRSTFGTTLFVGVLCHL